MEDLSNKVVAITGGATGIGFALAKSLGVEGAKIIIGEPRQEALNSAIARLSELGIEAISAPLDVANLSSVEAFADVAWEHYGQVDMLINNAGIFGPRGMTAENMDYAKWEQVLRTNTLSPLKIAATFAKNLAAGRQKNIFWPVARSAGR